MADNKAELPFAAEVHALPWNVAFSWLAAGWRDFKRVPRIALSYGLMIFVVSFLWLAKIGAGPGTDPTEAIIGRVLTFLYFAFFITMPVWTKLDRTKPVPERVTMHD